MNQLQTLGQKIDDYKRGKRLPGEGLAEEIKSRTRQETAVRAAREIIRLHLADLGIRAETVYTAEKGLYAIPDKDFPEAESLTFPESRTLIFELEPGGISELLFEMLQKK